MKKTITNEISQLRFEIPKINHLSDEYLISLVCYKYFYNNGELAFKDYRDCFVDGKNDGGIDLITVGEEERQDRLILIQSKMVNEISNKQDVIDIFTKIDQTVRDFSEYRTAKYNKRLKQVYKDKYALVEDQIPIIELVLFTTAVVTDSRKEKIKTELEKIDSLKDYQITIVYGDEIEEQIKSSKNALPFVSEGKIHIAKDDGHITFGENGLLVNISANSLKDLYDRYAMSGLFEQNFRYYVRYKRIDDRITESLRVRRDEFWYLNNGIIIGCKDFYLDGDNVKLYDFSIVNGAQTTTMIGEYSGANEDEDFYLPCKIVKPPHEEQYNNFIARIAEASNSQKPIYERDLKANKEEQRSLQRSLQEEEPKIYLEIKRGVQLLTRAQKRQLHTWQYIKNDEYGQLTLSFYLQSPGTARSSKRKLFADNKVYTNIFMRKFDKEGIVDLLKLRSYYNDFLNKNDLSHDVTQESVATNGSLIILAIIGFMISVKKKMTDINNIGNEDEWEKVLGKNGMSGRIFKKKMPDDFDTYLFGLFSAIIYELSSLYEMREKEEKTVSNFFKTDPKYRNVILKHFITRWYKNPMKVKEVEQYLQIFN